MILSIMNKRTNNLAIDNFYQYYSLKDLGNYLPLFLAQDFNISIYLLSLSGVLFVIALSRFKSLSGINRDYEEIYQWMLYHSQ